TDLHSFPTRRSSDLIDAEGGIGDAVLQKRQHHQARDDEGAVGHAADFLDARADRGAEDDEIKRGRENRRDHALQKRTPHARHLEEIDCLHGLEIHCLSLTRLTKMSSSELCRVCRSFTVMPDLLRSARSEVMPVRAACES